MRVFTFVELDITDVEFPALPIIEDPDAPLPPDPEVEFVRVVFTTPGETEWEVPEGVSSIDVLMVGGGGAAQSGGVTTSAPGGPGGGGVLVQNGITVTPGVVIKIDVGQGGESAGSTGGGSSQVRDPSDVVIAGPAGGGGGGGDAGDGGVSNGNGGGASSSAGVGPGTIGFGDGDGFDGGAGGASADFLQAASGGGGGASEAGNAGVSGAPGVGGNGGDGIVPPLSSFGPWGSDIGEDGAFGGGGPGRNAISISPDNWTVATRGHGGGAPNTGGGGILNAAPSFGGTDGYSGIVVIMYEVPA